MGEHLLDLANKLKHIVRFLDGWHEDLDQNGALDAVGRFLAGDLDYEVIRGRSAAHRAITIPKLPEFRCRSSAFVSSIGGIVAARAVGPRGGQ
jgi:hypothetical protein